MDSNKQPAHDTCASTDDKQWLSPLERTKKGKIRPTLTNCLIALRQSGDFRYEWGRVRNDKGYLWANHTYSDLITPFGEYGDIFVCGPEGAFIHDKEFLAHLRQWFESHGIYVSRSLMKEALIIFLKECREPKQHRTTN